MPVDLFTLALNPNYGGHSVKAIEANFRDIKYFANTLLQNNPNNLVLC